MTSKLPNPRSAFVWTWLPSATKPVVAGQLVADGNQVQFVYGRSYRDRENAIPLYLPELPLQAAPIPPVKGLPIASAIRDGAPDAWGRRVILNRKFGLRAEEVDQVEFDELVF